MSSVGTTPDQDVWRPKYNPWLITHEAHMQAYARIYQGIQAQAASLAYVDTFMVLAVGAGIMFCLAFVLKKNDPGGGSVHIAE